MEKKIRTKVSMWELTITVVVVVGSSGGDTSRTILKDEKLESPDSIRRFFILLPFGAMVLLTYV